MWHGLCSSKCHKSKWTKWQNLKAKAFSGKNWAAVLWHSSQLYQKRKDTTRRPIFPHIHALSSFFILYQHASARRASRDRASPSQGTQPQQSPRVTPRCPLPECWLSAFAERCRLWEPAKAGTQREVYSFSSLPVAAWGESQKSLPQLILSRDRFPGTPVRTHFM